MNEVHYVDNQDCIGMYFFLLYFWEIWEDTVNDFTSNFSVLCWLRDLKLWYLREVLLL